MTLILAHPWIAALYLLAALLGILPQCRKMPRILACFTLPYHAAAIVLLFFIGGAMEDVLLFLIFSAAVSLTAAWIFHLREDNK